MQESHALWNRNCMSVYLSVYREYYTLEKQKLRKNWNRKWIKRTLWSYKVKYLEGRQCKYWSILVCLSSPYVERGVTCLPCLANTQSIVSIGRLKLSKQPRVFMWQQLRHYGEITLQERHLGAGDQAAGSHSSFSTQAGTKRGQGGKRDLSSAGGHGRQLFTQCPERKRRCRWAHMLQGCRDATGLPSLKVGQGPGSSVMGERWAHQQPKTSKHFSCKKFFW